MAAGNAFPMFIQLGLQDDSAVFAKLESGAKGAMAGVRRQVEVDADAIRQVIAKAMTLPPTKAGNLDLGLQQFTAAAERAEHHASRLRLTATAAEALAASTGEASEANVRAAATARIAADAADENARVMREQVTIIGMLSGNLEELPAAHRAATAAATAQAQALRAMGAGASANQFAMAQLGQQVGDFGIQVAGGARPLQALSQQASQAIFILGTMGGSASKLAAFFSGPWGIGLSLGLIGVDLLTRGLLDNEQATKRVELGADALGEAQSVLGGIFDLTTGKLNANTQALILNARAKALNLRADAAEKAASSAEAFRNAGSRSVSAIAGLALRPRGSVGSGDAAMQGSVEVRNLARLARDADAMKDDKARYKRLGDLIGIAEGLDFKGSGIDRTAFVQALIDAGTARNNKAIADLIDQSLDSGKLATGLMRPGRDKKPRAAKSTAARDEFGRDAADKIASITSPFDETPAQIDKANAAFRQLDDLIDDLARKRPPNFEALIASAEQAKTVVRDGLIRTIGEAFAEPETLAQRTAAALAQLGGIVAGTTAQIEKLRASGGKGADAEIAKAEGTLAKARDTIRAVQEAGSRPLRDMLRDGHEQLEVQRLINAGRQDEAEILQQILGLQRQMGPLTDAQKRSVIGIVTARQREAEAAQVAMQQQAKYLSALADVQSNIAGTIAGMRTDARGALGGFVKNIGQTYDKLLGEYLTEKLFGDTFRNLEKQITGRKSPMDRAAEQSARILDDLNARLRDFSTAISSATAAAGGGAADNAVIGSTASVAALGGVLGPVTGMLAGVLGGLADGISAATDQIDEIVVTGRKQVATAASAPKLDTSPGGFLGGVLAEIVTAIDRREGESMGEARARNAELAKSIAGAVKTVLDGAAYGQIAGGLVLGKSGDPTGSAIGGAIGNIAGEAIGKSVGGLLGSIGGPIGSAIGGILGGLVGGAFRKINYGTASVTSAEQAASLSSNNSAAGKNAGGLAGEVQSGLSRIAEQLGGVVGSFSLAIGSWDGKVRVNTSATNKALHSKNFGSDTLFDFGDDAEGAIRFAILDALRDGAIQGIREGTKRLLQAGKDLDQALQKALDFEGVFRSLKERLDPVGAALDALNTRFTALRKIFDEAGASATELADLEKLYGLERAEAVKAASDKLTGALKGLLDDLTVGDNGRSLRDRLAAAQAAYNPLAARVAAGDASAGEAYAEAARALLDIQRQISGSGTDYFALLDQITKLTGDALGKQQALIDAATGGSTPFSKAANDTAPVVSAVDRQTDAIVAALTGAVVGQLSAVNDNLGTLIGLSRSEVETIMRERVNFDRANF